jgi:hypothetical protein
MSSKIKIRMNYGQKWKKIPKATKIYAIKHLNQNHNRK